MHNINKKENSDYQKVNYGRYVPLNQSIKLFISAFYLQ